MKRIQQFFDAVFKVLTIEQAISQNTWLKTKEAQQAAAMIERGRYLRHMALSELEAMENWNHQKNVKETLAPLPTKRNYHQAKGTTT